MYPLKSEMYNPTAIKTGQFLYAIIDHLVDLPKNCIIMTILVQVVMGTQVFLQTVKTQRL